MTELENIQRQKEKIFAIARQHGLIRLRIFGSVVRGEATPQSDIDLLVDLEPGRSMLDLGGALIRLQELLGRKVDIVGARPALVSEGEDYAGSGAVMKDDRLYLSHPSTTTAEISQPYTYAGLRYRFMPHRAMPLHGFLVNTYTLGFYAG